MAIEFVNLGTPRVDTVQAMGWSDFKTVAEANAPRSDRPAYVTPPEDGGYVLRIDDLTEPTLSPFENRNKKGELMPPNYQTNVTFTIVAYPNDDPDEQGGSVIGQAIRQFYTISLFTGSNFYKLARAAMGGDLAPDWKPNENDLRGKLVTATLTHKEKKNPDDPTYAKVEAVSTYRGKQKDFSNIDRNERWLSKEEWEARQNQEGTADTTSGDPPF
jgi:hypothetical protein